jgi:hypothetical protein
MPKPQIFISCGQYLDEEKELGKQVCELIKELTLYEPYFAERVTSLEGLSSNILGALNLSSGLIAIMHPRGEVSGPSGDKQVRASVWIEQEIAIAAFLTQVWKRKFQVSAYIHESIYREGIRDNLILNAVAFKTNSEVLEDLRRKLPEWRLEAVPSLEVTLNYERVGPLMSPQHNYRLLVDLTNTGTEVVSDYHVDLEFPSPLVKQDVHFGLELPNRKTDTHRFFRVPIAGYKPDSIYPGDSLTLMTQDYYIDTVIHTFRPEVLRELVTATVYVKGNPPLIVRKSISELQNF